MRVALVRGVAAAVSCAALAAAWFFLAPPQVGGRTSYAVVFGVSMEPHFHRGDLVLVRARPSYRVGEVVAYRSRMLHKVVLHRIVAEHAGRFTFKGDNNGFRDPEQPSAAALVGSEWVRIPRAGAWLEDLRTPRNAALAGAVLVLLLAATRGTPPVRRRRRRRHVRAASPARAPSTGSAATVGFGIAAAGAGALAAGTVLALVAFTRPVERPVVHTNLYEQHGRFTYAAKVRSGAAYAQAAVRSGDAVYLQLVHRLPVAFAYRLDAPDAERLRGTVGVTAVLHDDEGWRHPVALAQATSFTGRTATVHGILDLEGLERTIAAFERETGEHNTLYHLELSARVRVHGLLAGYPLTASFSPSVGFDLDQLRLAPSAPAAGSDAPSDPLAQSAPGAGVRIEPASLHAFGRSVAVASARRLAAELAGGGLALALVGCLLLVLGRRSDEVAVIRRRYDGWIVDVLPRERAATAERRVTSIDDLARLARRYDRLILHEVRDGADAFVVEDDGIAYTYVVHAWDAAPVAVRS
jgi:signal peptidase I